jgi:hypothetical protein
MPRPPAPPDAARPDTPAEDVLLGYGPALLIAAGGLALAAAHRRGHRVSAAPLTRFAGAILCFLAGVRRGTSFYTPGGAQPAEIGMFLGLFGAGFVGLTAPDRLALAAEALGFASLAAADPVAARRGRAPRFFAHLRPPQMLLAALGLAAALRR